MAAEWVTALSTLGTFVVIAASAAAALLQLRHMRSGNQISAYNECRETLEGAEFREALAFIRTQLPQRLADPATVDRIVYSALTEEYGGIRLVANLFESMGLFVKTGMMEQEIACELWSGLVLTSWNNLNPLTVRLRELHGEGVWINFEYMAVLSDDFEKRYPHGKYPANARRM